MILICEGRIARDPAHDYNRPSTREIHQGYRIRVKTCQKCGLVYSWVDFGNHKE